MSDRVRRIDLVEDDATIAANYTDLLVDAGYDVRVHVSRRDAELAFSTSLPDLALLDIKLGRERLAGFELCRLLRSASAQLPIIFLTNSDDEITRISALQLEADDFLTKDISLDFLLVRIETLFKRVAALSKQPSHSLVTGNPKGQVDNGLYLDQDRSFAYWKGTLVALNLTQYWTLRALYEARGEPVSTRVLEAAGKRAVSGNAIAARVMQLRRRIREIDPGFDSIESVPGIGYRWIP